ncbi:MAG: hypothetical protein LBT32_07830 [Peptococcaceae bacterium]|jgi:hypothetical protein|nr:hypothetical protein [Peptococcaceae bacterium]
MKFKFKKILSYFFALVLPAVFWGNVSLSQAVYAAEMTGTEISAYEAVAGIQIQDAEETQWYFRILNGVAEKRLWSITQRIWLTDWLPA